MKLYFSTNTLQNTFPSEFVESRNPKCIEVLNASLIYEDPDESTDENKVYEEIDHAQLHASFVHQNDTMDHFVCEVNREQSHVKCFPQSRNDSTFTLWFSDYAGRKITIDSDYHFVVELLLTF